VNDMLNVANRDVQLALALTCFAFVCSVRGFIVCVNRRMGTGLQRQTAPLVRRICCS
jgi:hypothetical protein